MKGINKLIRWAKPYGFLMVFVILFTILAPITYSYVPQFIKYVIDVILKNPEAIKGEINLPSFLMEFFSNFDGLKALLAVGVTLLIFQTLRGFILFLNGYVKGKLSENIAYDMRTDLYSHIQNLSYSYHNNVDTGDLIQRCTSDVDTIKSFLSAQLPELLRIIASFAAGAIQMALINVQLMLVTLCVIPITITASIFYFKYVSKKFDEIEQVEAKMTTTLQENVNGVRVVKAFAMEKEEIAKFNNINDDFKEQSRKLNNAMAVYWGSSDFITFLQYVVTMGVSVIFAKSGDVSTGDIIAAMMYIGMLVWPVRGLGRIIGDFGKSTVAARRVDNIMKLKDEYTVDGLVEPFITGNIEFNNVSFKFDDTDEHLLNNVSFTINKGETVAIIGKTGSGKSTIANLLVRMLNYDEGSILIDGVELKDIKKKWIRKHVGIILQDPFLYAKTIFENIKIGRKDSTEDLVYQAAQTAAIHQDILRFDEGYNTLVGEKGVTLSGGQKQRIAIARMLILDKPIMVFDDSLSAVDTKTDLMIRNALKQKNNDLTSIIITHRITTAKEADKIIVLENGKVSAIGTHQELANKEGLYKNLWSIQGALEENFLKHVKEGEVSE